MNLLKKKFRKVKKLPDWLFVPPALLLRCFKRFLLRTEVSGPYHLVESSDSFITVTWHNRLLYFPAMFPRHVRKRTSAVISASRDGQYIADLAKQFGVSSVRGSTSRKGADAQRQALKALRAGNHVSFTPDGPRGPRYAMSRGPIHLASISGHQIVPISINASRYWELGSWDGFQIPKPFARVVLTIGDKIAIPPDLNEEELEHWRQFVEKKLLEITADNTAKTTK